MRDILICCYPIRRRAELIADDSLVIEILVNNGGEKTPQKGHNEAEAFR